MNNAKNGIFKTPRREIPSSRYGSSENLKDPVHVFCRLRPLKDNCESTCIKLLSPTTISLTTPNESKSVRKEYHYLFKHVFTSYSTQKEIFDHVAHPLLEDLLKGKHGLLFTYGVTGSGKTYTLAGDEGNPGVMPRCIHTIFNTITDFQARKFVIKPDKMNNFEVQSEKDAASERVLEAKASARSLKNTKKTNNENKFYTNDGTKILNINESNLYSVFISYTEIYNNTVFDLLDDSTKILQPKIIREDSFKNMYVHGVIETEVKSAVEAFELFNIGQRRKRMGHTILNAESSRSHSIFNIRVVQLKQISHNSNGDPMIPEDNLLQISQLSLVDLAGSERCSRTQNTGVRLKEASCINNSLMTLRSCMEILRDNQLTGNNKLVPYRDSRLTLLFRNYFESGGNVKMIVCVNPSVQDFDENLNVMKFADMAQEVKISQPESRYTPYRTPAKKMRTPCSVKKPVTSFTLGPKLPSVKLDMENISDSDIQSLIKIVRLRRQKQEELLTRNSQDVYEFRKRLSSVHEKNLLGKSELSNIRALLQKEKQKSYNLESKVVDLETDKENLASKNDELKETIQTLRYKVNEKEMKINQQILEKEKTKQKCAIQNQKITQELDAKLRRQRAHLNAVMACKENKLQKVREILSSETPTPVLMESDQEIPTIQIEAPQTPVNPIRDTLHRRNVTATKQRQRRSRSVGEVWLEHNAIKPVPLGTVLQPSMKKRKSISKLSKASDIINPKQNKYCLISQEADNDGEMETKLYKADIVPTCSGGAQVIFNDVERLRQESPTTPSSKS